MGTAPADDPAYTTLLQPLMAFCVPAAAREHVTATMQADFHREALLWQLTPATFALLPALFPQGPFAYVFDNAA